MKPVEEIGLLKMDFLGLRNLDVIEDTLAIIERSTGERIDMTTLPLDDAKTYEMMARGDSVGVFQFESEGMREALKKVGPDRVRGPRGAQRAVPPGCHGSDPDLRARQEEPGHHHVCRRSPAPDHGTHQGRDPVPGADDADRQVDRRLLRAASRTTCARAIGKKNRAAMAKLKPMFFDGCRESGHGARA